MQHSVLSTDSRTPAGDGYESESNISVPFLYKAPGFQAQWCKLQMFSVHKSRSQPFQSKALDFQDALLSGNLVTCRWQNAADKAITENLTPSPIKHLKFVLWWFSCSASLTLWDPMDCSPPDSSVYGILQEGILEWVAILFFRESSWPRN